MRSLWLLTVVFVILGILGVCRTPDTPPAPGCTRLASGLEHCVEPSTRP